MYVLELEKIDVAAMKIIPEKISCKYNLIAFHMDGEHLSVAFSYKPDIFLLKQLSFISGMDIIAFISGDEQIKYALHTLYEKENVQTALNVLENENQFNEISNSNISDISVESAPIVKLVNSIINQAIEANASDIHIEPVEDVVLVRFRIDGLLNLIMKIPNKFYQPINTRLKIMCRMDITEKRLPQDGSTDFISNNKSYDLRVSTLPIVYGEKIVIRILYKDEGIIPLNSLGFDDVSINIIRDLLKYSHGIILAVGPTGSGKTTTLCSMLNELNCPERNIITVEEPIEYVMKGINQVNINNKCGMSFSRGLRSILRQDPDVIMIGEIRDEETAQIAVRASITGHLVLSTLHTNDAPDSVIRLIDMGIPRYLLNDSLIGVIAQRLVRKICPFCKTEYISDDKLNISNNMLPKRFYKGKGCSKCHGTGYLGRTIIYEIMPLTEEHKKIIRQMNDVEELRSFCISNGMIPIKKCGINLVEMGITTQNEILRATYSNI
jgi:type IV pilus assembly protein PilB